MTPAISKLIKDSMDAGYQIKHEGGNSYVIYKARRKNISLGVALYLTPTGGLHVAHRADVPLEYCTGLRTIASVRNVLGI